MQCIHDNYSKKEKNKNKKYRCTTLLILIQSILRIIKYIAYLFFAIGEDALIGDHTYRYLTADEMKSLGDDSLPIDVTRDERIDSNRMVTSGDSNMLPPQTIEESFSPEHIQQNYVEYIKKYTPDNVDIARHPINIG